MANKKQIASKMESKEYTNTRCGHCGKFGHHHSEHESKMPLKYKASVIDKTIGNQIHKSNLSYKESLKKKKTWADLDDKDLEYLMDAGHYGPHLH